MSLKLRKLGCLACLFAGPALGAFAGQGAQRLLYTTPNTTFVMQKSGETLVSVNDVSGSIATLQAAINNARVAHPGNVLVIRLTNTTYLVGSDSLALGSQMCLVASGATMRAVDASVTVPLVTIASGATNVSVAGGTLDGNGAYIQGIYAPAAARVNIDKVTVQNCEQDGILLKGQGNSAYDNEMTVTRCDVSGSPAHAGISIQNSTQTYVGDNFCHNNGQGIWLTGAWATIANNVCVSNVTGIDVAGGSDNVIANNTCDHNGTGIHAGASNNMILSNEAGNNSTAGINSNGSGNTFADNLFGSGNTVNFTSGGSGNHVVAYKAPLSASGQDYFYPPLIDDQHNSTIVNGMGRTDLTIASTTIASVQSQYNSARSANPNNVIVLHLNGTFTVGSSPLTLEDNSCVLLNGTIQINGSTGASAAIAGDSTPTHVSISGGIIDGGNLTGNNGVTISSGSMLQLDAVTLQNFGASGTRKGGSDVVHFSGGSTPQIITRCVINGGAARGIWFQTSGIKRVVSDCESTDVNQDGVDCDSSTSGSVVKFNYCHDNVRYGVFIEQSASHNVALGNVCNNNGRDINLYNNSSTPRGDVAYNSVIGNSLMGGNALRNGSTGTNVVQTSHNFFFNNGINNGSIESGNYGTQNYYSQNYQAGGSLSTSGAEVFFNSIDVNSNLFVLDGGSGLPALVQDASTANGAAVVIGSTSGLENDLWALIPTGDGYYRITNKKSQRVMAVLSASTSAGAPVIQWSYGSAKNDQWMPMSAGNGLYYFINRLSGLCLDLPGGVPGTQLDQQPYIGAASQQFNLNLLATDSQQPFSLSASPASRTVFVGSSTNFTVTLATNSGFVPPVTFSLNGLPANSSANFSPASLNSAGSTTLTVTTSNNTPVGSYSLAISGNSAAGTNTVAVSLGVATPGQELEWNSTSSTAWDLTTANWFDDFTGVNQVFQNGKAVVFTDRAGVVTSITIASGVSVSPTNVTVNAETNDYTFSGAGKITGATGLTKSGAGTLTLATVNDFTGKTIIQGGVLNISAENNLGANPSSSTADQLTLDGGTLHNTAVFTIDDSNRGITLGDNGGTFDVVSNTLTISKVITGPGGLNKTGENTLILNAVNTYAGGSTVANGALRTGVIGCYGLGPVSVSGVGVAYLNTAGTYDNDFNIEGVGPTEATGSYGAIRFAANSATATTLTGTIFLTGDARMTARFIAYSNPGAIITGQITGGGDLEFGNGGDTTNPGRITLSNPNNDWSGTTTISHGTLRLGASEVIPNGEGYGDVILNNSNPTNDSILDLNGYAEIINGLWSTGGNPTRCVVSNSSVASATLALGDNDADGTFGGVIKDGAGTVALAKIGAGAQTLTGNNSYTGPTFISGGALIVNGSLGGSAVTVQPGAILGGNGTLGGTLTVSSGGTVSPGNSIGVLTVNNAVTLQGATFMELNQSLGTNDVLRSTGTINYGGALVLTNLAGTLTTNDSFKLFSAAGYSGIFTSITPAIPGLNLAWDTNDLSNGVLSIVSLPTPSPQFSTLEVGGNNLIFSGTNGVPGWPYTVLASTNLTLPPGQWTRIATNYFDGSGDFEFARPLNGASPQQFFLIQLQ